MSVSERLPLGVVGGIGFGILSIVTSISEGKSFGSIVAGFVICFLIGTALVLYWTRDKSREDHAETDVDAEIDRLQNQLWRTWVAIGSDEAMGLYDRAAAMKSHAAVIERKLRRLGA